MSPVTSVPTLLPSLPSKAPTEVHLASMGEGTGVGVGVGVTTGDGAGVTVEVTVGVGVGSVSANADERGDMATRMMPAAATLAPQALADRRFVGSKEACPQM